MPTERVSFLGSFFPLPKTKSDADADHDPRQSIAERYQSRDDYLQKFSAAAYKLADDRFLLRDDIESLKNRGADDWDLITK
jgi:predicted DNA binding CopG/RHH family protein